VSRVSNLTAHHTGKEHVYW